MGSGLQPVTFQCLQHCWEEDNTKNREESDLTGEMEAGRSVCPQMQGNDLEELRRKRLAYFSDGVGQNNIPDESCKDIIKIADEKFSDVGLKPHVIQNGNCKSATQASTSHKLYISQPDASYTGQRDTAKPREDSRYVSEHEKDSLRTMETRVNSDHVNVHISRESSFLQGSQISPSHENTNLWESSEFPDTLNVKESVDIGELGLSTHRPESVRTVSLETGNQTATFQNSEAGGGSLKPVDIHVADTFGDGELRYLLGEEKYREFLEKSRRDIEALKLERKASPGRVSEPSLQSTNVVKDALKQRESDNFHQNDISVRTVSADGSRSALKLNRPKHVPALVSSFVVKSRGELDRELPQGHQGYGGKNYEQTCVSRNVAYSCNDIYKQAYHEVPYNPYMNYNGVLQGSPQAFSPRDLESLMYHGYPPPGYMAMPGAGGPQNVMYGQPVMYYPGPSHPTASPVIPHSPHPPMFTPSHQQPFSPHPPQSARGHVRMSHPTQMCYPYQGIPPPPHYSSLERVVYPLPQPPKEPPHRRSSGANGTTAHPTAYHSVTHHSPHNQEVPASSTQCVSPDTCTYLMYPQDLQNHDNRTPQPRAPHPPGGEKHSLRHPHREHVEGVRHFHENRRRQIARETQELNSSEQYAVDRLEKYFSSIEGFYHPKVEADDLSQARPSHHAPRSLERSDSPLDEELETLVASTITNLKAGGVTERLKKLGIEIPFLNGPLPTSKPEVEEYEKSNPTSPNKAGELKEAKICTECSAWNKSYMSWCASCGEILIGVEATVVGSKPRPIPTHTEGEDSGFDDRVSPPKPKVQFAAIQEQGAKSRDHITQDFYEKSQKPDTVDSGRGPSSGEERDKVQYSGRTDQEIVDICQSIRDPVIRGFLKSYLRKKNCASGAPVSSLSKKPQGPSTSSTRNSNRKVADSQSIDVAKYIDNKEVWLHEVRPAQSADTTPVAEGSADQSRMDIEVYGVEEGRLSRSVSRNGQDIPLLDLGFSSDEGNTKGKVLDLTLSDDEEEQDVDMGQANATMYSPLSDAMLAKLQSDPRVVSVHKADQNFISQDVRRHSPAGRPTSAKAVKHQGKTQSASGRSYTPKQSKTITRPSVIKPSPPKRHWMRSSIAWSSYNPRELKTKSSLPPPQGRRRGRRPRQGSVSKSLQVQQDESSSADSNEDLPESSHPQLQKRPASADILRRKAKLDARPESAGSRRKNTWQGQREINLKSRTMNMRKILGVVPGDNDTEVSLTTDVPEKGEDPEAFVPIPVTNKTSLTSPAHGPPGTPGHLIAQSAYDMYHSMTPRISKGSYSAWQCLPDEILLFIFSHLSLSELARCTLVCKHFYRVAMDQSLWRSISLKKRQDLSDDTLDAIGQRQPISLSLIQCHGNNITANGLQRLFQHCGSYLEELNISRCSRGGLVGDSVLLQASVRCKQLTHLDISWTYVTDNGLSSISSTTIRLESVCMNGCQSVTNHGLETLLRKHGKSLRVLELFGCFNINQSGIRSIAHHCHNLLTLNLGQCYKLTDSSVTEMTGSLPRLESLDIRGCKQVRDNSVRRIVKNCPRLTSIALANCPHISDIALCEIATYLTRMKWIDLCGCKNITDESLRALSRNCPNLYYLDISSTSCTKRSVVALANHCSQRLEVAKLNFLIDVDEASVLRLVKSCPRLTTLHLYGCKGLQSLVKQFEKEKPSLCVEMG